MTRRSRNPQAARSGRMLLRFDRVERAAHWANATLFLILIGTGTILYVGPLSLLVGRRVLIDDVHVYCGLALPAPLLISLAGRWGRGLRADLSRFNRWTADDRRWLRLTTTPRLERNAGREQLAIGKFNAGQKLNAVFVGAVIVIMLGTGVVMHWFNPWPLSWRTGATFVHEWLAIAVFVVVLGHITYALRDPAALRSMFKGTISRRWALRNAPAWVVEIDSTALAAKSDKRSAASSDSPGPTSGGVEHR
jgi:formate dehydrogenase gamma subunit